MGAWELFFISVPLLIGIMAGGTYAVIALTPADFQLARRLAWGSGILGMVLVVGFGFRTEMELLSRISLIAICGAVTAIFLTEGLRWITNRDAAILASQTPKSVGQLKPKREIFISGRKVNKFIQIGDSMGGFIYTGPEGNPVFEIFEKSSLTIETINGELNVSTIMFDRSGNKVAELYRNEWKVAAQPIIWDRNYDKEALEVQGPSGDIVLQVKVMSDRIQMQGEWWANQTSGIRMVASQDKVGHIVIFGTDMKPEQAPKITPLFVYPGDSHLGERVK